jgi:HPt (histidine-containing phosphotransfer) domain-containing protein
MENPLTPPTHSEASAAPRQSFANSAPVPPGGGPQTAVFDLQESLSRLGGDGELFNDILAIFLEDAPRLLEQASQSLDKGDAVTLERAAHSLKGLSANFAAPAAVDAGYAVELLARERRLSGAAQCFPRLEAEMHRLESALRDFRDRSR